MDGTDINPGSKYQDNIDQPTDNKKLSYQHNVAEIQEGTIGDNIVPATFPDNEKNVAPPNPNLSLIHI